MTRKRNNKRTRALKEAAARYGYPSDVAAERLTQSFDTRVEAEVYAAEQRLAGREAFVLPGERFGFTVKVK